MGHPPSAAPAECQPSEALLLEIAPSVAPEPSEPLVIPEGIRSASFVPPTVHTHSYSVAQGRDAHPHDPSPVQTPFVRSRALSGEAVSAMPAPTHFAMMVSTETVLVPGPRLAAAATEAVTKLEPGGEEAPVAEETVSSPARLAGAMAPVYPAGARAQDVEADVLLAIVVTSEGQVADARILKRAGLGFDEEALRAIRAAQFTPARSDGRRVSVRMRWSVSFRLR